MSVAIAELSIPVNQGLSYSKVDSEQNGLFEEIVRGVQHKEDISSGKQEISTMPKLEQASAALIVDDVVMQASELDLEIESQDLFSDDVVEQLFPDPAEVVNVFYPNVNYVLYKKNNNDSGQVYETENVLQKLGQSVSQDDAVEFVDQQKVFQDKDGPSNATNTKVEDLQKDILIESKINEPSEEKVQLESLKWENSQNLSHASISKEAIIKMDYQSVFTNNLKESPLVNQNNALTHVSDQHQSNIGLRIGDITHQDGVQTLKISILPEELGIIKLDLKTNVETKLTEAHFAFSHQDGFDLFQGNRQDLLALLGKSGLDIQPDKISFDLLSFTDSSSQFAQEHQHQPQNLKQKTQFSEEVTNMIVPEEIKNMQNNMINISLLNVMA